jgi:Popeye protein conserved region
LVELCIHVANIFYLASFLVRDIFWLRILTCVGLILGVIFFTCQATPMYGPTVWHVVFLGINALQIWRLIIERRKRMLTAEQQRIAEAAFRDLTRDQLLTLLTRAMCDNPERVRDLRRVTQKPLNDDERLVRDLAFSHLSRKDLLNLLTRRLWRFLQRFNPARWGQATAVTAPPSPLHEHSPETETAIPASPVRGLGPGDSPTRAVETSSAASA